MSRGPPNEPASCWTWRRREELENDDATVPRGSTEQAGKFPSIGKNSKSKEGEGRKEGARCRPKRRGNL